MPVTICPIQAEASRMTQEFNPSIEHWPLDRLIPHARNARTHVEPAFPLIQTALQYAPWLLGLLTLAGIGYVVWARIDDRNKGLR